ncbi:MAG TPA: NUDIX domain-containing protein [Bryobacteraceae bacterium]|jgi:ADP-ribose pyrophosphatase YjhB (NUDIX family)|nr:NUDIX domain-containing protein [Bryobacteraceae bacterium]
MNFEPEKFFVGLMDFFSILLPGGVLTFLLMGEVPAKIWTTSAFKQLTGANGVAAFLVASYLLGHLIFLLGSWLDELYDVARRYTLNTQIELLSRRGTLLPWPFRAAIWGIFKQERNLAVNCARDLRNRQLGTVGAAAAVNTFQWSKAWLTENKPKSLAVVQRFEADSKFFRCFVVVLLIKIGTWSFRRPWHLTGIAIGLLPLAMWRYMEQRFKATNQAYWSVLTAFASEPGLHDDVQAARGSAAPVVGAPTHAGGIVFRRRKDGVEFLLVEASRNPAEWVLPKGHIEKGEQPRDTAVREVHEETGVWARIHGDEPLGAVWFKQEDETEVTVQFFVMECVGRGTKADAGRRHEWLRPDAAAERLSNFAETKRLVQKATARLESQGKA